MAKTNPLIPTVDIQQQQATGDQLITLGTVEGTAPAGATYAGLFALECILQDVEGGGIFQNTGTVAVPAWTAMAPVGTFSTGPSAPATITVVNGIVTGVTV